MQVDRPPWMRGCDHIYYERYGLPKLLILSNLPLRGELGSVTHQMTQAVKLVVKERGFRAGRYPVAYVSCNDSGADGEWAPGRCAAHAREAAHRRKVVGVMLPIDLGCAEIAVPPLAAARSGPPAQIAVLNSALRLPAHGAVRLVAPLAAQAAADALLVRDLGPRSVAVVDDGSAYGRAFASAFKELAAASELAIATEPEQADAALVAGSLTPAGVRALRETRRRLPQGAPVVLAPAFGAPTQIAEEVGDAAEGAFIGVSGVTGKKLPEGGRDFAARFEEALHLPPHPLALYAAESAELLLDAIARSDGTRASVISELRRSSGQGLVGWRSFDAAGEPFVAPVTVYRIVDGGERFNRVITPPHALWKHVNSTVP